MHSALFVAKEINLSQQWLGFLVEAEKNVQTTQHVERLAKNVWMVNFQKAQSALGFLIYFAETNGVSYKILPFVEEPQWIPVEDSQDQRP
jgi:hypothetical protein